MEKVDAIITSNISKLITELNRMQVQKGDIINIFPYEGNQYIAIFWCKKEKD